MPTGETIRTGRCLCGGVRFETRGSVRPVIFCHCDQCRRQSGLHYAATSVTDDQLAVIGETLAWYRSSPEARRGFCSTCGTLLFWKHDGLDQTSILAGAFDQPSGLVPSHHIYTASKADFYDIGDGLEQFPERDGRTVVGSLRAGENDRER
ncbi:MAG TPA: GFA family protein [Aurantimonas coralicida]|uniref:GFA family protein n=2 Tax=root TaxID=1 RepID=A0A9C9NFN5_9HYPH|nr:GFA family protein [Aurantimonas coralicida]HEU01175.1 GFA family protein [Aurantimonas coralicida]